MHEKYLRKLRSSTYFSFIIRDTLIFEIKLCPCISISLHRQPDTMAEKHIHFKYERKGDLHALTFCFDKPLYRWMTEERDANVLIIELEDEFDLSKCDISLEYVENASGWDWWIRDELRISLYDYQRDSSKHPYKYKIPAPDWFTNAYAMMIAKLLRKFLEGCRLPEAKDGEYEEYI